MQTLSSRFDCWLTDPTNLTNLTNTTNKTNMPDILLVQPPIRDFYLTHKRTIPYGLACVGAFLQKNGFSVEILDCLATSKSRIMSLPQEMNYLEPYFGEEDLSPFSLFHHFRHYGYSFEHIGRTALKSGAFLVGISSLFTAYYAEAVETAETIKRFHPDCCIVMGGHHPTALPESAMISPAVDYVIRGEGEIAMTMLAKLIQEGGNPMSVPGIVFRKNDGTLSISPPAVVGDLDAVPLPAMNLVKQSFYARKKRGSTVITASRGCPMSCSYCSVGTKGLPYRKRSVESVLKEMENAVIQHNAGFIDFEDENLSLDKKWFLTLLCDIKDRFSYKNLELRAMNGLYPPSLDEEVIQAMADAGFKTLNLSLGSVSKEQLERFKRHDVIQAVEKAVAHAADIGMDSVCYIIAGAPGQNPKSSVDDLIYLAGLKTLAGVSIFYPSPGSADFRLCEKKGLLPETYSLVRSTAFPVSHTTRRIDAVTILRLGRILNFMKALSDRGIPLPAPRPFHDTKIKEGREETGIKLLSWFLHDGRIRGVRGNGEVYEHVVSIDLARRFIDGVKHSVSPSAPPVM